MSKSAVAFADAGAAELISRFRSQRSIKIAIKMCMTEIEGIMRDEEV